MNVPPALDFPPHLWLNRDMNTNRNLNCLYNVYTPQGMLRMTDREATKEFGSEWEHHSDHSEWCTQHGPFNDGNPPF